MKASQSDAWVGNKPIDWHLYNAKTMLTKFPTKNINFWPQACVPSTVLNAVKTEIFINVHNMHITIKTKKGLIWLKNVHGSQMICVIITSNKTFNRWWSRSRCDYFVSFSKNKISSGHSYLCNIWQHCLFKKT